MKVCTKCLLDKPLSAYAKSKTERFGVRSKCKDCAKAYNHAYVRSKQSFVDKVYSGLTKLEYDKQYSKLNRDKRNASQAKRRSLQSNATLAGYEKEIQDFYWLARDLKAVTGEEYHVDHIVPLRGANVCGLHVPWNLQILPADINLSKSNTFDAMKEEI